MGDEKSSNLHRDDCESINKRTEGLSCVFGKVVSLDPFEIEDSKARLKLEPVPVGEFELLDYVYVLFDTAFRPLRCLRVTVVPPAIEPVAAHQLDVSRSRELAK